MLCASVIHQKVGSRHRNAMSWRLVSLDTLSSVGSSTPAYMAVSYRHGAGIEGSLQGREFMMVRDWRVPEHLDTKSAVDPMPCSTTHVTMIVLKRRPFERSNNPRVMNCVPSAILRNSRDPVSLGKVEGAFHDPSCA